MDDGTEPGFNRTGAQSSPLSVHSMQLYADERVPEEVSAADEMPDGKEEIAAVRGDYTVEAERIGSVPMPGVLTSAFTAVVSKLGARKPEVLVDKLGERLAFERIGVRLYQALMDKAAALARQQRMPFSVDDLQRLRDDELAHMHVLASALDSLGADSTAQTPAAAVSAVAISGLMQVLTDPRTTLVHCLEAMLIAELADDASWELLISLTAEADQDQFLPQFRSARDNEKAHVRQIRGWLQTVVLGEAR
ncbi:ferritin-like domain-containing protein [Aromatoleum aromaticum]|uniref:Ferritin/DPS protein domain-containing protein n=1 Tax=Aromatoleum aromaticum (strain DSM 19018 / LMG 30748 / EbN1) TaxID=76114 RepID=Q5NXW2_AROAE|nr:ferritin-like domain-containing protein [Aromatoleum aromaticum]NMG54481.1 ferritin-like domain-containing protein [Aromatoleum aromaticum]CAI10102.1 hypothetical protein; INTERPRO-suggestion: probable Ferritin-like [Aromatoleum aromaticum EbN1]